MCHREVPSHNIFSRLTLDLDYQNSFIISGKKMDSEIKNDLSRLRTYFKNNFVQGIDEIRSKYEAKLSFKTFNVEALERDELTQKGLIEVQGEDIIERVRSASARALAFHGYHKTVSKLS